MCPYFETREATDLTAIRRDLGPSAGTRLGRFVERILLRLRDTDYEARLLEVGVDRWWLEIIDGIDFVLREIALDTTGRAVLAAPSTRYANGYWTGDCPDVHKEIGDFTEVDSDAFEAKWEEYFSRAGSDEAADP